MKAGINSHVFGLGALFCFALATSGTACGREDASAATNPPTAQAVEGQPSSSVETPGVQEPAGQPTQPTGASGTEAAQAQSAYADIARIVFIGQEQACACTRNRIDTTLAELQNALTGRADIPIDQLMMDRQRELVAPYRQMERIMVLPAIYFLDASGGLVEMLQGEITRAEFEGVLGGV